MATRRSQEATNSVVRMLACGSLAVWFGAIAATARGQGDEELHRIAAGGTETVWSGANVMGKVCIDTQGPSVSYWFIKNGRNFMRREAQGRVCLDVDPKLFQELRVHNPNDLPVNLLVRDDVSGLGIILAPLVSFEELGKAVGDGLRDMERAIRNGFKDLFNVDVADGQAGRGCYLIAVAPQAGTDPDGGSWVTWRTGETVVPATKLGRNIQLRGFELRLWKGGYYRLTSSDFGNHSRHSKWDSWLIVTPGAVGNGKHSPLAAPFKIHLGRLRKGRTTTIETSGSYSIDSTAFEQLESGSGRLYVCIRAKRYG